MSVLKQNAQVKSRDWKKGYFELWDIKYSSWNPGSFEYHSKYPIHFNPAKIFTMENGLEFSL